jgi:hypothetical protein
VAWNKAIDEFERYWQREELKAGINNGKQRQKIMIENKDRKIKAGNKGRK